LSYAPAVKERQSSSITGKKTHSYNNNEPVIKSSSSNNNNPWQPDTSHYQPPISSIQDISKSILSVSSSNSLVQPKLRISQSGDVYEQEADRIAEKVMSMPSIPFFLYSDVPPISGKTAKRKGIDKKCPACEMKGKEEEKETEEELNISRKQLAASSSSSSLKANDQLTNEINGIRSSGGSSLDPSTKEFMESRFGDGYDFSNVRIHADAQAAESAESINALAYTIGNHITFGQGQYLPNTIQGKRLLAHELTHVIQQQPTPNLSESSSTTSISTSSNTPTKSIRNLPFQMLQRDAKPRVEQQQEKQEGEIDPWSKLSPAGRKKAEDLKNQCIKWLEMIVSAQQVHPSRLRGSWINTITKIMGQINQADNEKWLEGRGNALKDITDSINKTVEKFEDEWDSLEKRYFDERRYLLSKYVQSTDSEEAVKWLDEIYNRIKTALDRGVMNCITDEDYSELRDVLDKDRHISLGMLRGSRARAGRLKEMMDAVADLRRNGEDAEKYVPNWSGAVKDEVESLNSILARANEGALSNYKDEFQRLKNELLEKQKETSEAHPREKSVGEKIILEVKEHKIVKGIRIAIGGVEAIVAPFVEIANEAYDMVQVTLYIVSDGKYKVKLKSDVAKAVEKGATRIDLLKGMVKGLVETPSRFMKAVEDGDWEGIGREAVNLYMLAEMIRASPKILDEVAGLAEKLPGLITKTTQATRLLRARKVALELKAESRLAPAKGGIPSRQPTPQSTLPKAGETTYSKGGGSGESKTASQKPSAKAPEREPTKLKAAAGSRVTGKIKVEKTAMNETHEYILKEDGSIIRCTGCDVFVKSIAERAARMEKYGSPGMSKRLATEAQQIISEKNKIESNPKLSDPERATKIQELERHTESFEHRTAALEKELLDRMVSRTRSRIKACRDILEQSKGDTQLRGFEDAVRGFEKEIQGSIEVLEKSTDPDMHVAAWEDLFELEKQAKDLGAQMRKAAPKKPATSADTPDAHFDVDGFEKSLVKLPPNERVAIVNTEAARRAQSKGYERDRRLSTLNNRDVYADPKTGHLYSVDTQHGRFEHCDAGGKHIEEVNFKFEWKKNRDPKGRHDLKIK
jgi:hypothetical protein